MTDLTDICSVEPAENHRHCVVLWGRDGERFTVSGHKDKRDADAIATRIALLVRTWMKEEA